MIWGLSPAFQSRSRQLCETWEPVVPMLSEKRKWRSHERESTDAAHGGGAIRSSDEVSVMEMERRGWIVQLCLLVNQQWDEPASQAKPMVL